MNWSEPRRPPSGRHLNAGVMERTGEEEQGRVGRVSILFFGRAGVFVAVPGLSLVVGMRSFSLRWLLLGQSTDSRAHRLQ